MVQTNRLLSAVVEYPPYNGSVSNGVQATTNLENIISTVLGVLSLVAFIYFVVQVIFAGYAFISSQGDAKKLEDARHKLTNGILGLTIIVIAVGFGALLGKIFGIDNIFDLNTLLNNMGL